MIRTGWFLFVEFDRIAEHERRGWMVIGPASHWRVLMWRCDCFPEDAP